ncbi:helix-turn-helix domain-containing protein [Candidatus Woesearchaeota archaeon]|nr:helix-turn-helix domain-containing protein [Candidatus Woesearchaeota archaeon]
MELPQEIEVWYIIPTIRKELAIAMKETGLKQSEIAKRLGLTKAAITNYINKKRAKELQFDDDFKVKVKESVKEIKNEFDAVRQIQKLLRLAHEKKVVCEIHKRKNLVEDLKDCNVCFE